MRAFAESWPDAALVQRTVAQMPWRSNVALLDKLTDAETRLWYAQRTIENGWSRDILCIQIESRAHERQGKAVNNFALTLPPADSDMAAQVFKDPYLFDFLGTADARREREIEQALVDHIQRFLLLKHPDDQPAIGLLLCRSKSKLVIEYALRGFNRPIGVAEWETEITRRLPKDLKGSLPTVAEIEEELSREPTS